MKLSIGQAWDETKQILRADGSAIVAIALALIVLPGAIMATASPTPVRAADAPAWLPLIGLVTALLSLIGQLAISRIAVGPPTTVGSALGQGGRRMPVMLGAVLLVALPMIVLLLVVAFSTGNPLQQRQVVSGALALPVAIGGLIYLYVFLRMIFLTPLAADTRLGPVALIKESWRRTQARSAKLLLLVLLLILIAVVLIIGLGGALSAVIILALGAATPFSASAALVALVQQVSSAVISILFVIIVSRLYLQAAGDGAQASVPHAGGD